MVSYTIIDNCKMHFKDNSGFKHFFPHKHYICLMVLGLARHPLLSSKAKFVLLCSLSWTPAGTPLGVRKAGALASWDTVILAKSLNSRRLRVFSEKQW